MNKKNLLFFFILIFSAYSSFAMEKDDDVKEACRLLVLKEGKDYSSWGGTPLHSASVAKEKRTDMIEFLVKEGADIRFGDCIGRLPIHLSAWGGHFDSAEWFLNKDKDLINMKSAGGWTPLHQAVGGGRPEIVGLLLSFGALTDGRVDCNNTLMHIAVLGDMRITHKVSPSSHVFVRAKERQECARILAVHGVNPGLINDAQETPAQLARKRGLEDMALFFEGELSGIFTKNRTLFDILSPML